MKIFAILALVLPLGTACTPIPELSSNGMRPGVGQDFDFAKAGHRNGQVVRFTLEDDDFPFQVSMQSRATKTGPDRFRHLGEMRMALPGQDLEGLLRQMGVSIEGAPIKVEKDAIVMPITSVTDGRGRAVESTFMTERYRYRPHDCFAVLGICRFSESSEEYGTIHLIAETTEEGGFWRTTTRLDPVKEQRDDVIDKAIYSVARDAYPIDYRSVDLWEDPGSVYWLRRVK